MEYYSNEIINIINNYDNYPIKYIDCDMYSNNFIDINIDDLIQKIANKLNAKIENNLIIYKNKYFRIIQTMNNDNWISYKYEVIII